MVNVATRQKLVLGREIKRLGFACEQYRVQFFWHEESKTSFRIVWMGATTHIQRQIRDHNNCVCWVLVRDDMWT